MSLDTRITTHNADETQRFASNLVGEILKRGHITTGAVVLALEGDLGGGKTTFTQGFARALHIDEPVRSPTFLIMKTFPLENINVFTRLVHIDAYRIESDQEMRTLGWDDFVKDSRTIIVVEWADKIQDLLPDNRIDIKFTFIVENTRSISIKNPAKGKARLGAARIRN